LNHNEKSKFMTFISSGIETGTLFTTFVAPLISIYLGWSWVFYVFGFLGIMWSIVFALGVKLPASTAPTAKVTRHVPPSVVTTETRPSTTMTRLETSNSNVDDESNVNIEITLEPQQQSQSSHPTVPAPISTSMKYTGIATPHTPMDNEAQHTDQIQLNNNNGEQGAAMATAENEEQLPLTSPSNYNTTDTTTTTTSIVTQYLKMFLTPAVWAIIIAHTCYNYGWYVLISWLPGYMSNTLGISATRAPLQLAIVTNLPYVIGFLGSNFSGFLADDVLIKRCKLPIVLVRKIMCVFAFFGSGLCYALLRYSHGQVIPSLVLICLAIGFGSFHRAGFFVNHLDIGSKRFAGTLMGVSNTFATIPGIIGNIVTGALLTRSNGDWNGVFNVIVVIYMFGGSFYLIFAKGHVIFK